MVQLNVGEDNVPVFNICKLAFASSPGSNILFPPGPSLITIFATLNSKLSIL